MRLKIPICVLILFLNVGRKGSTKPHNYSANFTTVLVLTVHHNWRCSGVPLYIVHWYYSVLNSNLFHSSLVFVNVFKNCPMKGYVYTHMYCIYQSAHVRTRVGGPRHHSAPRVAGHLIHCQRDSRWSIHRPSSGPPGVTVQQGRVAGGTPWMQRGGQMGRGGASGKE